MPKQRSLLGGAAALALVLCASASAGHHDGQRGIAILPPLESPDTDNDGLHSHRQFGLFVPYYGSPLTPISTRWRPIAYVPYYTGYCRRHAWFVAPPYGEPAVVPGPCPIGAELIPLAGYGPYTGAPRNEATLLHLQGNAPYQPSQPGAIDFIDMLRGPHGPEVVSPP